MTRSSKILSLHVLQHFRCFSIIQHGTNISYLGTLAIFFFFSSFSCLGILLSISQKIPEFLGSDKAWKEANISPWTFNEALKNRMMTGKISVKKR